MEEALRPDDNIQKTWVPEGTQEYKQFKLITNENSWLATTIGNELSLRPNELVLDVGGREGDIAFSLQRPESVHIVDPDPTITVMPSPGMFWNCRIQNVDLTGRQYSLILCSHILGYLGKQDASQKQVIEKLLPCLNEGGSLILFYNSNTGYMRNLMEFSSTRVRDGHFDYFDETILSELKNSKFSVRYQDVSFDLKYPDFDALARCCWFLFGSRAPDIESTANTFLPKLKADLAEPSFVIPERVVVITRHGEQKPIEGAWKGASDQSVKPIWTDFFTGAKYPFRSTNAGWINAISIDPLALRREQQTKTVSTPRCDKSVSRLLIKLADSAV